jgi:hypothetical protein
MAKIKLDVGAELDILTKGELDDSLEKQAIRQGEIAEYAAIKGRKYARMPRLAAPVVNAAVTLGGHVTGPVGPKQSFAWSIRRLACNGLATGGTPDILNIYRNGTNLEPVWQLNGNNFAYTFGRLELLLLPGETLMAANFGALAATGTITLTADYVSVPVDKIGELA